MTFHRHDFIIRERSTAKRIERWLTLFAGLLLAYSVFVFIVKGDW